MSAKPIPCFRCGLANPLLYHSGYMEPHLPLGMLSEKKWYWYECHYCKLEARAAETQPEALTFWNTKVMRPHYQPLPPDNAIRQHEALALTHQLSGLTRTLKERYLPMVPAFWSGQLETHLAELHQLIDSMQAAIRDHHLPADSIS